MLEQVFESDPIQSKVWFWFSERSKASAELSQGQGKKSDKQS